MNKKIVSYGEIVVDRIHRDGILHNEVMGGAPLNMLLISAQLLAPENCTILSALGNDKYGNEARELIKRRKVNCLLDQTPQATGTVDVEMHEHGIPSYKITENVAFDNISYSLDKEDAVRNADAFCFGTLAARSQTSRETLFRLLDNTKDSCLTVFDVNLRQHYYSRELLEVLLKRTKILKVNEEEAIVLSKILTDYNDGPLADACKLIKDMHALEEVICTCGADGSYIFFDDEYSFLPSKSIVVKDTVGGGDAFTAAYLCSRLTNQPVQAAHKLAVEVSGFVCTETGGQPLLPQKYKLGILNYN